MDESSNRGPNLDKVSGPPRRKRIPIFAALKLLPFLAVIVLLILLLLPINRGGNVREAVRRGQCMNNLKRIALALHNYAEEHHHALPPAYTTDADGKPLHSWRTLILPYLDEQQLYKTIDLTKPWDDPVNAVASKTRVSAYRCPSGSEPANYTTYLAVVTPSSCLRPGEPRELSEITDGALETLLVIEVDAEHAVPWMSPLDADEKVVLGIGPQSKLSHPGGVTAAFVDGHIETLNAELPAAQRRALISIAGGDKADPDGAE